MGDDAAAVCDRDLIGWLLDLLANSLNGAIPSSLGLMRLLEVSGDAGCGHRLVVQRWCCQRSLLQAAGTVQLGNNLLTGAIPASIGSLTGLT